MAELQKVAGRLAKDISGPMSEFAALHKCAIVDGALSKIYGCEALTALEQFEAKTTS
jgi:hypothetical protein